MCFRPVILGYAIAGGCGLAVSADSGWLAGALVSWFGGAALALLAAYLWFLFEEQQEVRPAPVARPGPADPAHRRRAARQSQT